MSLDRCNIWGQVQELQLREWSDDSCTQQRIRGKGCGPRMLESADLLVGGKGMKRRLGQVEVRSGRVMGERGRLGQQK